jgi:hypothetical protein
VIVITYNTGFEGGKIVRQDKIEDQI